VAKERIGPSNTSLCSASYTSADSMTLPAFAHRCCSNRSISPARRAHSSKPAAAGLLLWARAETDRPTDGDRTVSVL